MAITTLQALIHETSKLYTSMEGARISLLGKRPKNATMQTLRR